MIQDGQKTYNTPKIGRKLKTKAFLRSGCQMEQEKRWYRGQTAVLKKNLENKNLPKAPLFDCSD